MKFNILQENLKTNLAYIQKAIPNKPQLPILKNILLEVKDNILLLRATDLHLGAKVLIPIEMEEAGTALVPGEIFKQIIFSLDSGKINFQLQDNNLILKTSKNSSTLPFQLSDEFPSFSQEEGSSFSLAKDIFQEIDRYVNHSVSLDQTRPVLTSVLLRFSPNLLQIVGTDGFRLSILNKKIDYAGENIDLLVPQKGLKEILRIIDQKQIDTVNFELLNESKQLKFVIDNLEIYLQLIEGVFPPFEKILPSEYLIELKISGEAFLEEIKRAYILSRGSSNIIKIQLDSDNLLIKSFSPSLGSYQGKIPLIEPVNQNLEIAFNAKYLLDFLQNVKPQDLVLGLNETLKPALFRPANLDNFNYIVMPFRAND